MTDEEVILSQFIRHPRETRLENLEMMILPNDFMPGILRMAFEFVLKRISMNKSVDPTEIYKETPKSLAALDSTISGFALFAIWSLNRETDGQFKDAARRIKHLSKVRGGKGKLATIITK